MIGAVQYTCKECEGQLYILFLHQGAPSSVHFCPCCGMEVM